MFLKAKMLKTCEGSQDGRFVETFKEGEIVELSDDLYICFLADGLIEPFSEQKEPEGKTLSEMTKAELVIFAKEKLGLELKESEKKDDLIAEIELHLEGTETKALDPETLIENKALTPDLENK